MYSLICRYSKVGLIPNQQPEDSELSHYKLETPSNQSKRAEKIKNKLESSKFAQLFLFIVTIMATSMVIGDGILTPSISGEKFYFLIYHAKEAYSFSIFNIFMCCAVLSAVGGIKNKSSSLGQGLLYIYLQIVLNFRTYKRFLVQP